MRPPLNAAVCLIAGLVPVVFFVNLAEPYLAAKQFLLVSGAAITAVAWLAQGTEIAIPAFWKPLSVLVALGALSLLRVRRYDEAVALASGLILLFAALQAMRDRESRAMLATIFTGVGTLEAVYVLCQVTVGDPLLITDVTGKWRAFGTLGNPDWTGEFLALAILVTLGAAIERFTRKRAACLAILMAGLAATLARGAWVSLAVAIAALTLVRREKLAYSIRKAIGIGSVVAAAVVCGLALRPDSLRYLIDIASLRGRLWIWLISLKMIAEHPLGVGIGGFELHFPDVQARLYQQPWSHYFVSNGSFTPQAHNDYLQFIAETGVLALPAIILMAGAILRRGRSLAADPLALGFWAGVVSLLTNSLYAFPLYLPASLACGAILLGATEAASDGFHVFAVPRWPRLAMVAGAAACAVYACLWSWNRVAADFDISMASAQIAQNRWDRAEPWLDRAVRRDPGRMEAWSQLARAQMALNQFSISARTYAHAQELGFSEEIYLGESKALWHAGRHDAAIDAIAEYARLRPDLAWPREKLAELRAADAGGFRPYLDPVRRQQP